MGAKFDYDSLASTSVRLINRFGKAVLKRTIVNSGTEWNPTQTNVDTTIDGVVTAYGLNEIDGSLILASDKKLLTSSLITISDKIVDGSISYSVISVSVVEPADISLLYKVQLRV